MREAGQGFGGVHREVDTKLDVNKNEIVCCIRAACSIKHSWCCFHMCNGMRSGTDLTAKGAAWLGSSWSGIDKRHHELMGVCRYYISQVECVDVVCPTTCLVLIVSEARI